VASRPIGQHLEKLNGSKKLRKLNIMYLRIKISVIIERRKEGTREKH
jgi:hypothetical protein